MQGQWKRAQWSSDSPDFLQCSASSTDVWVHASSEIEEEKDHSISLSASWLATLSKHGIRSGLHCISKHATAIQFVAHTFATSSWPPSSSYHRASAPEAIQATSRHASPADWPKPIAMRISSSLLYTNPQSQGSKNQRLVRWPENFPRGSIPTLIDSILETGPRPPLPFPLPRKPSLTHPSNQQDSPSAHLSLRW